MAGELAGVVAGIVDTHVHQWDPLRTPREASAAARVYRLAPRLVERLVRVVLAQPERELVLTAQHVARRYLPEDYAADADEVAATVGVGIDAVVHVEAGWHAKGPLAPAGETRWVAALPFGHPGAPQLGAIVAHADLRSKDCAELLDAHLAASAKVSGIRHMGARHPDPKVKDWTDQDGLLASRDFLAGFAQLADRGLTFDAWVYSGQLTDVATLAREYPETTIVLDHYGTPVGLFGPMGAATGRTVAARAAMMRAWRDDIAALAQQPNVVAKHSGLAFPPLGFGHERSGNIGDRQTFAELMAPLIDHVTDVFGPDRLMFGSNYPMDKPNASLATIIGALVDVLAPRGDDLLRKVFRDNAARIYRLDDSGAS
jgi:L-fuconolactonase